MDNQQVQVSLTDQEKAAFFKVFTSDDGKLVMGALQRWTFDKIGMTGGSDGQMQSNFLFFTEGERNLVKKISRVVTAFANHPPTQPKKRTRKTV